MRALGPTRYLITAWLLVSTVATACTLFNSVDPLAAASDGGGLDSAADVATDASDAQTDAAPPPKGVIVVGGVVQGDAGTAPVLTALAPENGHELPNARERLLVASVQYDGLRDLWYVFETRGTTHFPTPSDAVVLHVRLLDTHSGRWDELQALQIPTMVANTHVAVLRERIVYVAYRTEADGGVGQALVTIDTTDPTQPSLLGSPAPLARAPIGLLPSRSSTGAGGTITLVHHATPTGEPAGGPCDGGAACLELARVVVSAQGGISIGPPQAIAQFVGAPAFGTFLGKGTALEYVGYIGAPPNGILQAYLPTSGAPIGAPIPISMNDAFLKPIAFADCLGTALLIGTNTETAVNAIPVEPGRAGDRGVMQHSGQSVHYEPFTSTVLAPFTQGNGYELTAFTLAGTPTAVKLTPRSAPEWVPPPDLRPEIVATRSPLPVVCP